MRIPERALRTPSSFPMGGPALAPRRPPRHPSLAPPASSPPRGGGETGLAVPSRVLELLHTGARVLRPHVPVRGLRAHSHEPHHEVCLCACLELMCCRCSGDVS
eukprot:1591969-Prymnesium_polylepis.4